MYVRVCVCVCVYTRWKTIVDNLVSQDKTTFRDLLARVHYPNATGVVNIFSSLEQEAANGGLLLKRIAFAILSGEVDQYMGHLPTIQGGCGWWVWLVGGALGGVHMYTIIRAKNNRWPLAIFRAFL